MLVAVLVESSIGAPAVRYDLCARRNVLEDERPECSLVPSFN